MMSGKVLKDAVKESSKIFQQKNSTLKSASTPPPLPPSRAPMKAVPSSPLSRGTKDYPFTNLKCPRCGENEEECKHQYEEIGPQALKADRELHKYEPLLSTGDKEHSSSSMDVRLRTIEDNQMCLRNEFNDFRDEFMKELRSFDSSIKRLVEINDSLHDSMGESFAYVHSTMDTMHTQLLENNDNLGKQIVDVRRDFVEVLKSKPSLACAIDSKLLNENAHIFEWEVGNLENIVKYQQSISSQSYLIGKADFKMLAGAVCTRDGLLRFKIYGEFMHMPINSQERKNVDFQCTAFIVDRNGKHPDLLIGKVNGCFSNDKTWNIGDVSVSDIKIKGYTERGGQVNMKLVIDVKD